MKQKHRRTLEALYSRPTPANIQALLVELGAEITEREGSRVGVFLFGEVHVYHRPQPGH